MRIYIEIIDEMKLCLDKLDMIYRVNDYFQVFIKEEYKKHEKHFIDIDKQINKIIELCNKEADLEIISNSLLDLLDMVSHIKAKNLKMLRQFLKLEIILCLDNISKTLQLNILKEM